ncbi:hypothetical protein FS837_012316, partial [Tulasnella sp. UAMH 9824]
ILLQIFECATDDPGVLDHTPSWKHYDLSLSRHDSDVPWRTPSGESERTAIKLGMVCRYWRPLVTGLELRHVPVHDALQLPGILDRLSGTPDAGKSVKGITLKVLHSHYKQKLWKEEDTGRVVELLKLCPNLEVFTLEATVGQKWTSALSSLSFLEALEISSEAEEAETTSGDDYDPVCLPSLKHFRVSTPEAATAWLRGISKWTFPSLTNLYLAAPDFPCYELPYLLLIFGGSLKSLSLDANTSLIFPMDLLGQTSLEHLGIYTVVNPRRRPSAPLPSISTVAIRLSVEGHDCTVMGVCRAMQTVAWISKESFTGLETVVVIGHPIEDLDKPCQIAKLGSSEVAGLACERWDQQGVRVVNRRGIRVLRLVANEVP